MDRSVPVKGFVFLENNENCLDSEYLLTLPIIEEVAPENSPSMSSGNTEDPVSNENSSKLTKRRKNTAPFSKYGFEHICNACKTRGKTKAC